MLRGVRGRKRTINAHQIKKPPSHDMCQKSNFAPFLCSSRTSQGIEENNFLGDRSRSQGGDKEEGNFSLACSRRCGTLMALRGMLRGRCRSHKSSLLYFRFFELPEHVITKTFSFFSILIIMILAWSSFINHLQPENDSKNFLHPTPITTPTTTHCSPLISLK